jgi:hypothetical protein
VGPLPAPTGIRGGQADGLGGSSEEYFHYVVTAKPLPAAAGDMKTDPKRELKPFPVGFWQGIGAAGISRSDEGDGRRCTGWSKTARPTSFGRLPEEKRACQKPQDRRKWPRTVCGPARKGGEPALRQASGRKSTSQKAPRSPETTTAGMLVGRLFFRTEPYEFAANEKGPALPGPDSLIQLIWRRYSFFQKISGCLVHRHFKHLRKGVSFLRSERRVISIDVQDSDSFDIR